MIQVGDVVFHEKSCKDGLKRIRGKELNNHHYRGEVVERALNNTIKIKWNSSAGGPSGEKEGQVSFRFYPVSQFYKTRNHTNFEKIPQEEASTEHTQESPQEDPQNDVQETGTTPIWSRKDRPKKRRHRAKNLDASEE